MKKWNYVNWYALEIIIDNTWNPPNFSQGVLPITNTLFSGPTYYFFHSGYQWIYLFYPCYLVRKQAGLSSCLLILERQQVCDVFIYTCCEWLLLWIFPVLLLYFAWFFFCNLGGKFMLSVFGCHVFFCKILQGQFVPLKNGKQKNNIKGRWVHLFFLVVACTSCPTLYVASTELCRWLFCMSSDSPLSDST